MEITGSSVCTTQVDTEEEKGILEGMLHSNSGKLTYKLGGWLLHHVSEESEE